MITMLFLFVSVIFGSDGTYVEEEELDWKGVGERLVVYKGALGLSLPNTIISDIFVLQAPNAVDNSSLCTVVISWRCLYSWSTSRSSQTMFEIVSEFFWQLM